MSHFSVLSYLYIESLNFPLKFSLGLAMYPTSVVSKPFSDTSYGHGNIPLRVEGSLDLARRCTVVFLLLFSWEWPPSGNKPQHLLLPPSHFLPESRLQYLILKRRKKPFIWTQLPWYLIWNNAVFKPKIPPNQPARWVQNTVWGNLNTIKCVAGMTKWY